MQPKDTAYSIPINIGRLMKGQMLDQVDIRTSIHQHIHLLLRTFTLSYRFDPAYGSILNRFQACTPPQQQSEKQWREELRDKIQRNISDLLQRYETRIQISDVFVSIFQPDAREANPLMRVQITVHGNLKLGRKEAFHYPDSEIDPDAQEAFPLMIPIGKK